MIIADPNWINRCVCRKVHGIYITNFIRVTMHLQKYFWMQIFMIQNWKGKIKKSIKDKVRKMRALKIKRKVRVVRGKLLIHCFHFLKQYW